MKSIHYFTLASLLATTPIFAGDQDLLKVVDAETDLVIHIADTQKTLKHWEKSTLREFVMQPQFKAKFDEWIEEATSMEGVDNKEAAELIMAGVKALAENVEGELLMATRFPEFDSDQVEEIQERGDDDEYMIPWMMENQGALVLGEIKKDTEDLEKAVAEAFKAALEIAEESVKEEEKNLEPSVVVEKIGDYEVTKFAVKKGAISVDLLTFGVVQDKAFLSMGNYRSKDLIAELEGGADKPISQRDLIWKDGKDVQVVADLSDLIGSVGGMLTAFSSTFEDMGIGMNVKDGWEALGLEGIDKMAMTIDISEPATVIESQLEMPERGFIASFIPKDSIDKPSPFAHKGVTSVSQMQLSLSDFYQEVRKLVEAFAPQYLGPMDEQIGSMETAMSLKLEEDFLKPFGSDVTLVQYSDPDPLIAATKIVGVMEVTDRDRLEATLKTLVGTMGQEIEQEDFLGMQIQNIPFGSGDAFSYAFHDGQVLMGLKSAGGVKEALKQIKNPRATYWDEEVLRGEKSYLNSGLADLTVTNLETEIRSALDELGDEATDAEIDLDEIKIPFSYLISGGKYEDFVRKDRVVIFPKN